MSKYVVISSTDNSDYDFYIPILEWAWWKFGWQVLFFHTGLSDKKLGLISNNTDFYAIYELPIIEGYRKETIAQCSRLYVGNYTDLFLMTSDSDILPLSDYWNPRENEITCYGRDLSDRHQPMCYIAASGDMWKSLMSLTGKIGDDLKRDLDLQEAAKSDEWAKWWQVDQDIISERLSHVEATQVHRGIAPNSHYPLGRIDRGNWDLTLQQPERIDAHLFRKGYEEENWQKILSLIIDVFNPTIDEVNWLSNYRNEYIKLL